MIRSETKRRDFLKAGIGAAVAMGSAGPFSICRGSTNGPSTNGNFKMTWAVNFRRIAVGTFVNYKLVDEQILTTPLSVNGAGDMKPSWSKTGDQIVFMRVLNGTAGPEGKMHTSIMNADGTGIKNLTAGEYGEWHPTWFRDGSMRVIGIRPPGTVLTHPDKQPGEEEVINTLGGTTVLMDGTILSGSGNVRIRAYNANTRRRLSYAFDVPFPTGVRTATPSVSPDETKIAFAPDFSRAISPFGDFTFVPDDNGFNYDQKLIYIGDLDKDKHVITNLRNITPDKKDDSYGVGYPRWSPDSKQLVYHSSKNGRFAVALYDLDKKTTRYITGNDASRNYPCFQNSPM